MDDDEDVLVFTSRARKIDWLIIAVDAARRFVGEVETVLANVEQMLVGQANYEAEQNAFADQARLDIETLTQEE